MAARDLQGPPRYLAEHPVAWALSLAGAIARRGRDDASRRRERTARAAAAGPHWRCSSSASRSAS